MSLSSEEEFSCLEPAMSTIVFVVCFRVLGVLIAVRPATELLRLSVSIDTAVLCDYR